ncbi:GIY-YIG nuclease family protein [Actinoallomurus acaciae]|uniref:GIY-YIG nuclease family protein n=1 Tax=Actinoallomurus acaciae TaxID=502577 RepID=A0ABV5YB69_9ACTN
MTPAIESSDGETYHSDFTLSITKALGDQLADALDKLGTAPLSEASLQQLAEKAGVYQLYLRGEFVYVGKADKSLPGRLRNHLRKLSGRRGLSLSEISFSCLYVAEDFSALAPEQLLINHHKGRGAIPWNNNGFGNKDPGRRRDDTTLKANHFDMTYPINLDYVVQGLTPGITPLHRLLEQVKAALPYNFRYERLASFRSKTLTIPSADLTADWIFRRISGEIPGSWQVAALMGYVIMYDDRRKDYPSAWRYYRDGYPVDASPEAEPAGSISESDAGEED